MVDVCVPRRVGFHHRVEDREELAHSCRHRDFLGFPSRAQPLIEGVDDRVTARRGLRGPVQDHTDLRTPAAHMACAGSRAALVMEWGAPPTSRFHAG
jgi:hypothetical protein